jgi:hypothetical protein
VDPQKIGPNLFNPLQNELYVTNIFEFSLHFDVSYFKVEELPVVCCENRVKQGAEFVNAEACGIYVFSSCKLALSGYPG